MVYESQSKRRYTVNDCPNSLPQQTTNCNQEVLAKALKRSIKALRGERNGFGTGFGGRIIIKA
jgi:hypothetical protein